MSVLKLLKVMNNNNNIIIINDLLSFILQCMEILVAMQHLMTSF